MKGGVITTALVDGTPVLIRPVGPDDAVALLQGFSRLSSESRVFRFLRAVERLDASEVDRFTRPDHALHEAIGALAGPGYDDPAGIAHFFRAPAGSYRAELALTVTDPYQRLGLGALLLGRLLRLAREAGLGQFDAVVHGGNHGMIRVLRQLGATISHDDGTLVAALPVHDDPARYPANRTGDRVRAAWALEPRAAPA